MSWTAPAADGDSPITGYLVTGSPGGATCSTGGELTCDVPNLPDGAYTFTVVANNGVGSGPASTPTLPVAIDATAPSTPGLPVTRIAVPSTLGATVPVTLSWTASSDGSGIDHYEVWRSVNGGPTALVAMPTAASWTMSLAPSATYRFGVRAVDTFGNPSPLAETSAQPLRRVEQSNDAVRYRGTWTRVADDRASGGSYRRTSASGASAKLAFTGRGVAVVAKLGPKLGKLRVYLDGVLAATISERSTAGGFKRVVFSKAWASSGHHTIRLVRVGTTRDPLVNLDAFLVVG